MLVLISRDLLVLASLHTVTELYAPLERTSSHLYKYSKAEMQLWETSVNSHLHIPKLPQNFGNFIFCGYATDSYTKESPKIPP